METRILETSKKKDVRLFKSLPFNLYRENPYWVPPIPGEIEFSMDKNRHPFYKHSEADFIVVKSGRDILGRILVIHNKNYCEYHKENTAFFFYYEAVEEQQVADLLLSAAQEWCKKRHINEIVGSRGLLRSACIGLLVDGFDQQPATGMTYNLPYYEKQILNCGFEKFSDHYSGILETHINPKVHEVARKVLSRGKFSVKTFKTVEEMKTWIPRVDEIHHRAFSENPGYVPSTPDEFEDLAGNILALADPRYVKAIMYEEEIAGFIIAFPNINRGLRFARSRFYPIGWLGLLLAKAYPSVIDIEVVGMLPEYQGLGGNALLYSELDKTISGPRIKRAEIVQVDERNVKSKSDMDNMNVVWNKTHRTFRKVL
ncbi:MAG TPA: hypothetical protein DIW44_15945 [Anaerolineaceae bacterium]|nr:hypothetical protein [Anaerolineaceae bacterium]